MLKSHMSKLKSLLTSILLSSFIYLEYFNLTSNILNTIVALFAFYLLFTQNKKELFLTGFITSILWFWWIGYSFIYYELTYLIPIVLISIGLLYGLLFFIGAVVNNIFYKGVYFFIFSYFEPFGFNWFKLELLFVNSYISIDKITLFSIILSTVLLIYFLNKNKKLAILIYISIISSTFIYSSYKTIPNIAQSDLKIELSYTNIAQDIKWHIGTKEIIISDIFKNIDNAIEEKKDLIIFPETALPLVLNKQENILSSLIDLSHKINIIVGSLNYKDDLYYNSSYFFKDGNVTIANKVVLVPFGEAVPLPAKIRNFINDTFYNGAKDYEVALKPTTFNINGVNFRNAICYEATTDKVYEKLDADYIVAISNNAWFTPSHQPTLQKLLLKYFAKKYNVVIYSVTNRSGSDIIKP